MNVVHCSTEDMQNPHASYDIAQQSRTESLAKLEKRRLRTKEEPDRLPGGHRKGGQNPKDSTGKKPKAARTEPQRSRPAVVKTQGKQKATRGRLHRPRTRRGEGAQDVLNPRWYPAAGTRGGFDSEGCVTGNHARTAEHPGNAHADTHTQHNNQTHARVTETTKSRSGDHSERRGIDRSRGERPDAG